MGQGHDSTDGDPVKLSEHLSGFRAAKTQSRALDPALPSLARSPVANLWTFRQNALDLMRAASAVGDVARVDLLYKTHGLRAAPRRGARDLRAARGLAARRGARPAHRPQRAHHQRRRVALQPADGPAVVSPADDRAGEHRLRARRGRCHRVVALGSGAPFDVARHAVRLFAKWATPQFGFQLTDAEADRYPDALLRLQRWGVQRVAGGNTTSAQTAKTASRELPPTLAGARTSFNGRSGNWSGSMPIQLSWRCAIGSP